MIAVLGKPDPKSNDEEEDELKEKEHVSMDQLDDWEKNFINMPVSEMFSLLTAGKEKYYLNFLRRKYSRLRLPLQKFTSLFNAEPVSECRLKVILLLQVSSLKNQNAVLHIEGQVPPKSNFHLHN